MPPLSRRSLLKLAGLSGAAGTTVLASSGQSSDAATAVRATHTGHAMGTVGRVTSDTFSPSTFLRAWNFSDLPDERRARYYL